MKLILTFIIILSSLFSIENKLILTQAEQNFIKNNPKITLGIDATWEPYIFVKDGKIIGGYDYDILKKINALANTNIELVPGVWNDVVEDAKDAKLYGLATSVYSKERAVHFEFTKPILIIRNNMVVQEGNPQNIHSLEDLKGKVIGIQKDNGFQMNRVKNIQDVKIVEFQNYEKLPFFLKNNKIDAIPMSDASIYTLHAIETSLSTVLYLEDDSQTEIVCSIN